MSGRKPNTLIVALALGALAGGGSSCGVYSFKSSGGPLVESIAVTQLENQTDQAGIADRITELVVDQMIRDGTIDVLGPSSAEAALQGALVGYRREAFEYDEVDQVPRFVVKLTIELSLVRRSTGDVIWKSTFANEGVYEADGETEEDGQLRAAELLVVDIINKTTRTW
ncbi:MAG: LPS assembly lipoprotein LptE [Candidatus Zixiibacteriota bacterium]